MMRSHGPEVGVGALRWTARRQVATGLAAALAAAVTWGCGPEARYSTPPDAGRTGPRVGDVEAPRPTILAHVAPAAAPAVAVASVEQLFPHGNGDTWEMARTLGGKSDKVLLTVTGSTEAAGVCSFSVETQSNGGLLQAEGYVADSSGLYRVSVGVDKSGRVEPRMPVLRAPIKPGDTWEWKGKLSGGGSPVTGSGQFALAGPEKVKTPAGEFDAYRLDQTLKLNAGGGLQVVKSTQWLAPKVGLVKQVTDDGAQRTSAELTKYAVLDRWK